MSENLVFRVIPPGIIVCLKCSVGDEVAADATFQIDNSNIDENTGRVVDGVLVLFDTESVFTTARRVQCMSISLNVSHSILMSLNGKSYYTESLFNDYTRTCVYMNYIVIRRLVITGNTTLNEGDTLYLDCDASTLKPRASVKWLSPERVVVSNERILEIMNIQRSAAGIYTCVATRARILTTNITVDVTVQCECHDSIYIYMYIWCLYRKSILHYVLC